MVFDSNCDQTSSWNPGVVTGISEEVWLFLDVLLCDVILYQVAYEILK